MDGVKKTQLTEIALRFNQDRLDNLDGDFNLIEGLSISLTDNDFTLDGFGLNHDYDAITMDSKNYEKDSDKNIPSMVTEQKDKFLKLILNLSDFITGSRFGKTGTGLFAKSYYFYKDTNYYSVKDTNQNDEDGFSPSIYVFVTESDMIKGKEPDGSGDYISFIITIVRVIESDEYQKPGYVVNNYFINSFIKYGPTCEIQLQSTSFIKV